MTEVLQGLPAWSGFAAGKVILLGEHAVVYGRPAIAVGIERGARARATRQDDPAAPSELHLASAGEVEMEDAVLVRDGESSEVARGFSALLERCGIRTAVRVDAVTDLPARAGLGCSAALGVAIVRALDAWQGNPRATLTATIDRAMAWEEVFHGKPSGVDATTAARGGCLYFQRTHGGTSIKEVPLGGALTLAVGHSGVGSSTKTMVEMIAKLRDRRPAMVEQAFDGIRSLVDNARLALEVHDAIGLGKLMNLNQMILSGLMLSTEEIETMCRLARDAGALGAKLTGSGGGGCVVALAAGDAAAILAAWTKAGFSGFATTIAAAYGGGRRDRERAP